mgnify:CR=1 FL=1
MALIGVISGILDKTFSKDSRLIVLIMGIILIFLPIYLFTFGEVHEPGSEKFIPIFKERFIELIEKEHAILD